MILGVVPPPPCLGPQHIWQGNWKVRTVRLRSCWGHIPLYFKCRCLIFCWAGININCFKPWFREEILYEFIAWASVCQNFTHDLSQILHFLLEIKDSYKTECPPETNWDLQPYCMNLRALAILASHPGRRVYIERPDVNAGSLSCLYWLIRGY